MERLPYAQRMRNRCIAITVLVFIIVAIVHCSTKEELPASNVVESNATAIADSASEAIASSDTNAFEDTTENTAANGLSRLTGIEDEDFEKSTASANDDSIATAGGRDVNHIKSQKDPFLADKIDILLRRYHPDLGIILVVDTTWVQGAPVFSIVRDNFPDWKSWCLLAAAFAASYWGKVNPILVIVAAAVLGLLIY